MRIKSRLMLLLKLIKESIVSYRVYPDLVRLRRQSKLACNAIHDLANFNVEVLNVKFRRTNPLIEVSCCAGLNKIKSMLSGQGINAQGHHYLKRSAVFCGCEIEWREIQTN